MLPATSAYQTQLAGESGAPLFQDVSTRTLNTVRIGENAGKISSGWRNVFAGYEAGREARGSTESVAIGFQASAASANTQQSVFVGAYAGAQNQNGAASVFVGFRGGELNRDGTALTAVGAYAMRENWSGTGDTAVGYRAMERCLDGDYNTVVGAEAAQDLRSGNFNAIMGYRAGCGAQGNENCFFGAFAGYSNEGSANSLFGYKSGMFITDGSFNTAIGAYTLANAARGSSNVAIGPYAAANTSNGSESVVVGPSAAQYNTQASRMVVIGSGAGISNIGDESVLIGANVAQYAHGSRMVVLGAAAAPTASADGSVIIGYGAAPSLTFGESNVLVGAGADTYTASNSHGIAIGTMDTYTSDYAISIGEDIQNKRAASILMGFHLQSDATNSVILGNNINLQSVVFFKDPLSYGFVDTIRADALDKLGVTYISYTDTLVFNDTYYQQATAGVVTEPVVDSTTSNRISPMTFDLRPVPPNYAILHGIGRTVLANADLSQLIRPTDASIEASVNIFIANSNTFTVNTDFLWKANDAYAITYAASNVATNVIGLNASNAQVPIAVYKRFTEPVLSNVAASNYILIPSPDIPSTGISWSTTSSAHLKPIYVVETPPQYGQLQHGVYSNVADVIASYTAYPESVLRTSSQYDSVSLRPYLQVLDNASNAYGLPSPCNVQLTFAPPTRPSFYAANALNVATMSLSNLFTGVSNASVFATAPIRITSMDAALVLNVNGTNYSSNDIALMIAENIDAYPPASLPAYMNAVYSNVQLASQAFVANYHALVEPPLLAASNLTVSLVHSAYASNVGTADVDPLATFASAAILSPEYNFNTYSNAVNQWTTTNDASQSIFTETTPLLSNIDEFWTRYTAFDVSQANSNLLNYLAVTATCNVANVRVATDAVTLDNLSTPHLANASNLFRTIDHKYNEIPRLFMTVADLASATLFDAAAGTGASILAPLTYTLMGSNLSTAMCRPSSNVVWNVTPSTPSAYALPTASATTISLGVPSASLKGVYISHPPFQGTVAVLPSCNISYTPYNPWASTDNFEVVIANAANETRSIAYTLTKPATTKILPSQALHVFAPPTTTYITTFPTYDIVETSQHASNLDIVYVNTALVSSNVIDVPVYNPLVGTFTRTSNLTIESNEAIGAIVDSNVLTSYVTTSNDITDILGAVSSSCNVTVAEEFASLAPDQLVGNHTTVYSNLYIDQTFAMAYDTHIVRDANTEFVYHFWSSNRNAFMYTSNAGIRPSTSNINASYVPTQGGQVLTTTSNMTTHSNAQVFTPTFGLTHHHLWTQQGNANYTVNSAVLCDVVRSNVGPVTSFHQSNVDSRELFVRFAPTAVSSASLALSGGNSLAFALHTDAALQPTAPLTASSNTNDITHVVNADNKGFGPTNPPTAVHILDVRQGSAQHAATATLVYATTATPATDAVTYVPSVRDLQSDTIRYFYTAVDGACSPEFETTMYLQTYPLSHGQDFNMGSYAIPNQKLDPQLFFQSYSYTGNALQEEIVNVRMSSGAISITPSTFNLASVRNGSVSVAANGLDYAEAIMTYDIQYAGVVIESDKTFRLRAYRHYDFPQSATANDSHLRLESFGYDTRSSNVYVGGLVSSIPANIAPSNVNIVLETLPTQGFITIPALSQSTWLARWSLDAANSNLFYVPYIPMVLPNEDLLCRLEYGGVTSPAYRLKLKNYISRFGTPTAYNPTLQSTAARTLNPAAIPLRSAGLIADGFTWSNTTGTLVVPQTFASPLPALSTELVLGAARRNFVFEPFTGSARPTVVAGTVTKTIDQAHGFVVGMTDMSAFVTYDANSVSGLTFIVTRPPIHGVLHTPSGGAVASFGLTDNVYYQHLGATTTTDVFEIAVASTPYDVSVAVIRFEVQVLQLPQVTANTKQLVTRSSVTDALSVPSSWSSNVFINSLSAYVHVLSSNVATFAAASFSPPSSGAFVLQPAMFAAGSNAPYPEIEFEFAVNSFASADTINPLINVPMYHDLFVLPFTATLNEYSSSNSITAYKQRQQNIEYTINPALAAASNLANRTVTMNIQVEPTQPFAATIDNVEFLRTFAFSLKLYQENGSTVFSANVYHDHVVINGQWYAVSEALRYDFDAWNNLTIVNKDPDNEGFVSLYLGYSVNSGAEVNATRNLLNTANVPAFDFGDVRRIALETDIEDSNNYYDSITYTRELTDLQAYVTLTNYATTLNYRNLEILVSTFTNTEAATYAAAAATDTHNIIVGKGITVRGTKNICVGNRFTTSGNSSIIIGNDIGYDATGSASTGQLNDVFESIVIGNGSFTNSIVRNVIAIGTAIMPDLFRSPVAEVNTFLSQKPILVGNALSRDKLDFHINVGDAFLKTSVGGDQIYLGLRGERVGIGYMNNQRFVDEDASSTALYVNGDVKARYMEAKHVTTVWSTTAIMPRRVVIATGTVLANGGLEAVEDTSAGDTRALGICAKFNIDFIQGVAHYKTVVITDGICEAYMSGTGATLGCLLETSGDGGLIPAVDDIVRARTVAKLITLPDADGIAMVKVLS